MRNKVEVDGQKVCAKCGSDDFGTQGQCNPCKAIWGREWYANNTDKVRNSAKKWRAGNSQTYVDGHRRYHLKKKYGMTLETYDAMLADQGNKCAICETKNPQGPGKRFMVDHNHDSGVVRGLLCSHCNFMLGQARNSTEILAKAIVYLDCYA